MVDVPLLTPTATAVVETAPPAAPGRQKHLLATLAASATLFVALFATSLLRIRNHGGGFDSGYFRQAAWLITHGKPLYVTVRRIPLFGDHLNVMFWLVAQPTRWIDPLVWFSAVQAAAMTAFVALTMIFATRVVGITPRRGWFVFVVVAAQPAVWGAAFTDFHPDVIALPFLAIGVIAACRRQWLPYGLALAMVLCVKEDLAMAVAGVGIVTATIGFDSNEHRFVATPADETARQRRIRQAAGAASILAAGAVFAVATLVQRRLTGLDTVHAEALAPWGSTLASAIVAIASHPGTALRALVQPDRFVYAAALFLGFAFLPLRRPRLLLPAVPALSLILLSGNTAMRTIIFQYSLVPFCFTALAFAAAAPLLRDRRDHLVVCATTALVVTAFSPLGFPAAPWQYLHRSTTAAALEQAARLIPPEAAVSATPGTWYALADRSDLEEFPEPYQPAGTPEPGRRRIRDPEPLTARQARPRWIVVDLNDDISPAQRRVLDQLLQAPGVETRFKTDDLVVLSLSDPPGTLAALPQASPAN